MIAKVIAHGRDRNEALSRLAGALGDTVVIGPHANAAFLKALVSHPEFRAGRFDTGFIDRNLGELTRVDPAAENGAIAAAVETLLRPQAEENNGWGDPGRADDGFAPRAPRRDALLHPGQRAP